METGLFGKRVIVTGGGSNIGRGIVLAFAREGCNILIAELSEAQANKVASTAQELGASRVVTEKTDVTKYEEVEAMADRAVKEFGGVDILVNSVGGPIPMTLVETTPETRSREINLNLMSTINCTRAVLPYMIKQQGGKIISMASEAGQVGQVERAIYSACKGGVIALTKSVAKEVAKYDINVNAIAPGGIIPVDLAEETSEFSIWNPEKGYAGIGIRQPGVAEQYTKTVPLARLGRPTNIADAVLFLASDAASFMTGQTLSINGGTTTV